MAKRTQMQEIISVFKKEGNAWMDYNEVYAKMDKSLFGRNKSGEAGKRRIVYRCMLVNDMFEENRNSSPKKFRLRQDIIKRGDPSELERVFSTGDTKVFINGRQYNEVKFSEESEIEDEVESNSKLIFGPEAVYIPVKKKIGSSICDAIVFNPKVKRLYIIENELSDHNDLYRHIVPQIIDFFNGMKDKEVQKKVKYNIKWSEYGLGGKEKEIIECIDMGLYDVVVVIDRIDFEIRQEEKRISELVSHFTEEEDVKILFKEFNVFVDDDGKKVFRVK